METAGFESLAEYPGPNARYRYIDRRGGQDRRKLSRKTHHHHLVGGRRKGYCRRSQQYDYYVDWHNPFYFVVVASIMMLSVFDALMTTVIISVGGEEINPFLKWVAHADVNLFVQAKLALTGLGLILLTRYIHFRVFKLFRVSQFMLAALAGYSTLIFYEVFCFI